MRRGVQYLFYGRKDEPFGINHPSRIGHAEFYDSIIVQHELATEEKLVQHLFYSEDKTAK
jgi:hypothetical protein